MKSVVKTFVLFFVLTLFNQLNAQEKSPSLSFGLDQVLFGKGTLDVELLASMVADKQDELKKRIVEQEILEPMFKNSSFATKNYVFSVIKNLMNEKDKNVLKKELMEHTSNYALVYTLAEMYLQLSWNDLQKGVYLDSIGINANSCENNISLDISTIEGFQKHEFIKFKLSITDSLKFNFCENGNEAGNANFNQVLLDMIFHAIRSNPTFIRKGFCNKPLYFSIDQYRLSSDYQKLSSDTLKLKMYQDVKKFIDAIGSFYTNFELLLNSQNNDTRNSIQVFQEELNLASKKLFDSKKKLINDKLFDEEQIKEYTTNDKKFIEEEIIQLQNEISSYFTFDFNVDNYVEKLKIQAYEYLKNDTTIDGYDKFNLQTSVEDLIFNQTYVDDINITLKNSDGSREKLIKDFKDLDILQKFVQPKELIVWSVDSLINQLANISISPKDLDDETNLLLKEKFQILYQLKENPISENSKFLYDKITTEILPNLARANIRLKGELKQVLNTLQILSTAIKVSFLQPMLDDLNKPNFCRQIRQLLIEKDENVKLYLEFFSRLDKLDHTETYYYLLKNLLQSGGQVEDQSVANAMNVLLQGIDKYTAFETETDKLDVDVENIILSLFQFYGNRDKNPLNFYLTVGLNNTFQLNNPLRDAIGNDVSNFSYASEKIGLRLNLVNWKMRASYVEGEKRPHPRLTKLFRKDEKIFYDEKKNYKADPIVSNLHAIFYGSGLLYQLTDLSTSKNMNSSFMGSGLGLTFYNNLSFNTSVMWPIKQNECIKFQDYVLNIGFDVYFTEYIQALNKKRKENKKAKIELEKYKIDKEYEVKREENELKKEFLKKETLLQR